MRRKTRARRGVKQGRGEYHLASAPPSQGITPSVLLDVQGEGHRGRQRCRARSNKGKDCGIEHSGGHEKYFHLDPGIYKVNEICETFGFWPCLRDRKTQAGDKG